MDLGFRGLRSRVERSILRLPRDTGGMETEMEATKSKRTERKRTWGFGGCGGIWAYMSYCQN